MLTASDDAHKMTAGELPHLAGETDAAIGEEKLGFADAARIEQELAGRGVAGGILEGQAGRLAGSSSPPRSSGHG